MSAWGLSVLAESGKRLKKARKRYRNEENRFKEPERINWSEKVSFTGKVRYGNNKENTIFHIRYAYIVS